MNLRWGGWFCFVGVALGAQSPAEAPPEATFRTGVKLVQVSVIAQDKQGKPVVDLRRDDFQILEDGSLREIRLFLAETSQPNAGLRERNTANTFTNQIASATGSRSGYSVILIDNLLTDFGDPFKEDGSGYARLQTLRMLRSIPAGERIAIYALQRKLVVICEFTSDRDLLERQLQKWTGGADTPSTSLDILGDGTQSGDASEKAMTEAHRIDTLQRASVSNIEMEEVADHLAGIPGRKNLIWLANRFVINPRAVQKLKDAGVAIYPVDPAGLKTPHERGEAMSALAAQTGGAAYFGRNDIDAAIREAMDDGRVSYMLGFYQSDDSRASRVHGLTVSVSRPGVTLRYRTGYQTEGPRPASTDQKAELLQALNRPIDATALPVKASVERAQDRLNLVATLDLGSLDLALNQNRWTGRIKLVARFTAADGSMVGEALSQTLDFKLRQATYDAASRTGLAYRHELKIPPKAVELKLLIANPASGRIGTLTIPLSQVRTTNR